MNCAHSGPHKHQLLLLLNGSSSGVVLRWWRACVRTRSCCDCRKSGGDRALYRAWGAFIVLLYYTIPLLLFLILSLFFCNSVVLLFYIHFRDYSLSLSAPSFGLIRLFLCLLMILQEYCQHSFLLILHDPIKCRRRATTQVCSTKTWDKCSAWHELSQKCWCSLLVYGQALKASIKGKEQDEAEEKRKEKAEKVENFETLCWVKDMNICVLVSPILSLWSSHRTVLSLSRKGITVERQFFSPSTKKKLKKRLLPAPLTSLWFMHEMMLHSNSRTG